MFISSIRAGSTQDRSVFGDFWFAPLGFTKGHVRVTPATAMGLPTVYSCIKVIAESFAIMPFGLFQEKAGGGRTKNKKHWLHRLLAKRPNRFQTPYEFWLMIIGHCALRGNAFCQITANGKGEIVELLPLHPDRMSIEPLDNGSYRYIYRDQAGNEIPYARQDIWHLRGLSDDGYMGLSPIALAREAIGEGLAIQAYSNRFFANDARPGGGWIENPHKFADTDAKKTFRDSWHEMQGGVNRGKVAVLEGGMKYHELGLNNQEAQFIEARAAKKSEIASIWRIPPHKVGDLSDSKYANIEQQSIDFWTDTMLPWTEMVESSIEYFLLGPDDPNEFEVEFDMRRMMRGDSTARSNYLKSGIFAGWLTRNEARVEEGYDPLPGLDEPLTPLNMVEQSNANDGPPSGQNPKEDDDQQQPGQKRKPAGKAERRAAMAQALLDSAAVRQAERLDHVLRGNAARMARRLLAGQPVPPALLAEALGVSEAVASSWQPDPSDTEEQLTLALMTLGEPQ